jgi:hypothetical protein
VPLAQVSLLHLTAMYVNYIYSYIYKSTVRLLCTWHGVIATTNSISEAVALICFAALMDPHLPMAAWPAVNCILSGHRRCVRSPGNWPRGSTCACWEEPCPTIEQALRLQQGQDKQLFLGPGDNPPCRSIHQAEHCSCFM